MDTIERIRDSFSRFKIRNMQLDPNGSCNAGCWFCPVRYRGNPESAKTNMPVELLEKILANIIEEREREDGLVDKAFNGFYVSHYNEVLMYRYFEDLLKLCRKYKLIFMVLSNGTTLTKSKTDLLLEYRDVISGVCLNVPCFEPELWSKRVNLPVNTFNSLVKNINYFIENHPMKLSIQVNGWSKDNNWIQKGKNFPSDIQDDENEKQFEIAKQMFPKANVFKMIHLIDRAGDISDVITNKHAIDKYHAGKKVIGCQNSYETGGRPVGWVHVNANGQCFLCCNDVEMEMVVGDFKTNNLRDFWGKPEHVELIKKSYETICTSCAAAKFE